MTTIKEDYVSFETAKLLKEKGFDNVSSIMYKENGEMCINPKSASSWRLKYWYPCLTLQMAMKWLREVHHIYLNINVRVILGQWSGYDISIHTSDNDGFLNKKIPIVLNDNTSYEQACEEAIKYCLENLI